MHYSIQLNCYRHILETHYDKTIIGMYLLIMHPNNETYLNYKVPMLTKEITDLMNGQGEN